MWKNLNSYTLLVGMENGITSIKNSVKVPQIIKNSIAI